jgi:hypothetical protein
MNNLNLPNVTFSVPPLSFDEVEYTRSLQRKAPLRSPNKANDITTPTLSHTDIGPYSAAIDEKTAEVTVAAAVKISLLTKISQRLSELFEIAREEEIACNVNSLRDMIAFLNSIKFSKRPAIFLLDSGNFRLVWKNEDNEQFAAHFLGRETVNFVIFKVQGNGDTARVAGTCSLNSLWRQVEALNAAKLLTE